ncbi:LPS export ABC transporter permease LptF [Atopomonas sediminilitoris]|uniref:LPS export ABC transporter permease LptF n=1 Tax=Atopomonas sediminilitoris TaxID=2919919 RepID=UPI001F4D9447|nr:LPS export ABC transporter permease LptF [Atopomonas sediminilitoris]
MIVFRYLAREVLLTLSAVTAVLLVIIMSGRFIKYLAQAAQGALDPSVLLLLMAYRMPGFLQLILPLGLFLGILLAYGRLYLESEMTVLTATGMSQQKLLSYTLWPAAVIALLVAWLSLSVTPQGVQQVEQLLAAQKNLTEFDTLQAGRFQAMKNGERVTYTNALSDDRTELGGVFISERRASAGSDNGPSLLVAESGRQEIHPDGSRYLILENGYRYDGHPGRADYRVIQYDTYGVLLPKPELAQELSEREAMSTEALRSSTNLREQAELQWRLAMPVLVLIITVLAVPLAKVNPRQGRYLKLLPAALLYMTYLGLLIAVRGWMEKGKVPMEYGLWLVHGVFLLIGLLLLFWEPLRLKLRPYKELRHA